MHSTRFRARSAFLVIALGTPLAVWAVPATTFAITATNVTMPHSGLGVSHYKVTGIPFDGTMTIACQYSGKDKSARIPTCTYGPLVAIPVKQGQTVTGEEFFYPWGSAIPLDQQGAIHRFPSGQLAGLWLAGVLLIGAGLRPKARRWLTVGMLAAGSLAASAGLSGCIWGPGGMTPGTYPYTISANVEANPVVPLGRGVSTTISVTVP